MTTHGYVPTVNQFQRAPYPTGAPPLPSGMRLSPVLDIALYPSRRLMELAGLWTNADTVSEYIGSYLVGPSAAESQFRLRFARESSLRHRRLAAWAAAVSLLATLVFPVLHDSSFLESKLYDWSFLAAVVFCGRYLVVAAVSAIVAALEPRLGRKKRWSYYVYALGNNLASTIHAALILLTWQLLHFATALHPITLYGAWLFCAWLGRCALILGNAGMMARWKANAMYERFEDQIVRAGFQAHILYKFMPSDIDLSSVLVPWRNKEGDRDPSVQVTCYGSMEDLCCTVEDHIRYLSGYKVTMQEVATMASCMEGMTGVLPQGLHRVVEEAIRVIIQEIHPDETTPIDKEWMKEKLELSDEDARVMYAELRALVSSPNHISYRTFSTWMKEAYRGNEALGEMLREEEQAIVNVDRLIMGLLISEAFLLWMLFIGNTITKVFFVVPLLWFAKWFVHLTLLILSSTSTH